MNSKSVRRARRGIAFAIAGIKAIASVAHRSGRARERVSRKRTVVPAVAAFAVGAGAGVTAERLRDSSRGE